MAEQHWGAAVALGVVAPHVKVPLRAARCGKPCSLKPGVELAGVVKHQIENHLQSVAMGCLDQSMQRRKIAELWVNIREVRDVVTAIAQG